jgi:hypothetical protein
MVLLLSEGRVSKGNSLSSEQSDRKRGTRKPFGCAERFLFDLVLASML